MCAQAQVKQFPGYGVVYPSGDGITGLKVIRTFTGSGKRVYNPDGSVTWTIPPATIHELYGGGFSYADGNPVTMREHLESIGDVSMRERALQWFDGQGKISPEATANIPPLDLEHQQRPEPVYVVSSDIQEKDIVTTELTQQVQATQTTSEFTQILTAITELANIVKGQGEDIEKLKSTPPAIVVQKEKPVRLLNKKMSEVQKARWADPEYRAKRIAQVREKRRGKDTPQTSETM